MRSALSIRRRAVFMRSRFNLSRLSLRSKLLLVQLIPLLLLGIMTYAYVSQKFAQTSLATADANAAKVQSTLSSASSSLGRERLMQSVAMSGARDDVARALADEQARVDSRLKKVNEAVADMSLGDSSEEDKTERRRLRSAIGGLKALRTQSVAPQLEILPVLNGYDDLIDRLDSVASLVAENESGNARLSDLSIFQSGASHESAAAAYVSVQMATSAQVGADEKATAKTTTKTNLARAESLRSTFQEELADAKDREILSSTARDQRFASSVSVFSRLSEGVNPTQLDLSLTEFETLADNRAQAVEGATNRMSSNRQTIANAAASDSRGQAVLGVVLALLGFCGAVALTYFVARSIAEPLGRLVSAAKTISRTTMPALVDALANPEAERPEMVPLPVEGDDEIGELAKSINQLQQSAIEVSHRQSDVLKRGISDIFVNLARRNQGLLDRQIEFIDEMESTEQEPEQLDRLFKLDHLATRMRRNAESLLVLAGVEQSRRRTRDVSLADVIRVAVGEVEDYQRINVRSISEVTIVGGAAVDLAHVLSELMENGTQYSSPEQSVEVEGVETPDGSYAITVRDAGVGMTDAQIRESNQLLGSRPSIALNVGRSLGFVVVAALAARHRISVRVQHGQAGGLQAVVTLPAEIFARPGEPAPRSAEPTFSIPELRDAGSGGPAPSRAVAALGGGRFGSDPTDRVGEPVREVEAPADQQAVRQAQHDTRRVLPAALETTAPVGSIPPMTMPPSRNPGPVGPTPVGSNLRLPDFRLADPAAPAGERPGAVSPRPPAPTGPVEDVVREAPLPVRPQSAPSRQPALDPETGLPTEPWQPEVDAELPTLPTRRPGATAASAPLAAADHAARSIERAPVDNSPRPGSLTQPAEPAAFVDLGADTDPGEDLSVLTTLPQRSPVGQSGSDDSQYEPGGPTAGASTRSPEERRRRLAQYRAARRGEVPAEPPTPSRNDRRN